MSGNGNGGTIRDRNGRDGFLARFYPVELRVVLEPGWHQLRILIASSVLLALTEFAVLAFLLSLSNAALGQSIPATLDTVLTTLGVVEIRATIMWLAAALVTVVLGRLALVLWQEATIARWRTHILETLQNKVMANVLRAPLALFHAKKQGDLHNGCYILPAKATHGVLSIPRLVTGGATTLVISIFLFQLSRWVFLVGVGLGVVFGAGILLISQKIIVPANRTRVKALRGQAEVSAETTAGIRDIKAFHVEASWAERFAAEVRRFNRSWAREYFAAQLPPRVMEAIVIVGFTVALAGAAATLSSDSLVVLLPVIATFGYGIMRLYPALTMLGQSAVTLAGHLPHARALLEWLEVEEDEAGRPGVPSEPVRHAITFDDVSFSYDRDHNVLRSASFSFRAGEATGVVGTSGSGKSTILDLVLKMIQPDKGRILVDGRDLATIDRVDWLSCIGFVDQDIFLFHGTISENVRIGKIDATDQEVARACERAGLSDWIGTLPGGVDTVVGDRGLAISGGQRQRIAIARALVRQPEILIFDEATSSLDTAVEAQVMKTLWGLAGECTLIIAAHRLSTVRRCDAILVLEEGRLLEAGSPGELLARRGAFYDIMRAQQKALL